jgi:hypothetical protein
LTKKSSSRIFIILSTGSFEQGHSTGIIFNSKGIILLAVVFVFLGSVLSLAAQEPASLWDVLNVEFFPVARFNTTGAATSNEDYRRYYDEKRLLRLDLEFSTDFGLDVNLNLDITQGILANKSNPLFSNIPFAPGLALNGFIDTEPPFESYLAYEGALIDVSVGRRKWGMGAGEYSLTVGKQAPWFDGVWFNAHPVWAGYRVDWTFLIAADDSGFIAEWNKDDNAHSSYYGGNDGSGSFDPLLRNWDSRYFLMHKSSVRGETWRAGVGETAMVIGNLDLFSGNPTSIWHSTFLGHVNIGIELSFEKRLANSWRVYSELFIDDVPLEGGVTNPIAASATIGADFQVFPGTERFSGPIQASWANAKLEDNLRFEGGLILSAQAVYASRYVYSRSYDEAIERFTMVKHTIVGDFRNYEHYIGFEYGPDTLLVSLSAQWQNKSFLVKGGMNFLVRGEYGVTDQKSADSSYWGGFHQEDGGAQDWFFSGVVAGVQFIADVEGFYAINRICSAYARLQMGLTNIAAFNNNFLIEAGILFKL